ncbi:MSHA biogenesis protein MshQ [Vibrio gigantis]|uniref:DUF6701 domain-containing protein n=1 Tax=Vibrio gigantis TaxID=296199 RepID=UPI003D0FE437
MKSVISILFTLFMIFPVYAVQYNISDPNSGICKDGSGSLRGNVFSCPKEIELNSGDSVIASSPIAGQKVQLKAKKKIELKGRNTIGTPDVHISISSEEDIVASDTGSVIYGDVTAKKSIDVKSIKIYGDVESNNESVVFSESSNEVYGDIDAKKAITLKNILVCGEVDSDEDVNVLESNNKIISTDDAIDAKKKITIENTQVCGELDSKDLDIKDGVTRYCAAGDLSCSNTNKRCPASLTSLCTYKTPPPPFPTVPQTCDVFKGPAQRWASDDKIKLHLKSGTKITNTTVDGKVGFFNGDESNKDFKDETPNGGCDGLRCAVDESLVATVAPSFIDIDNDEYESVVVKSGSTLDGTILESNYYHEVEIESGTLELQGEYVIETLKIGKDHHSGSAILKVGSQTKLHVNNIKVEHNGKIAHLGDAEDFWIIVHGNEAHFHSDDAYQFNALILANTEVKLHKNVTLNGGVTSQKIDLHDNAVLNGAVPNDCLPEQPGLKDVPYEFGSIEGMDCTNGCNLLFQKQYENPIVFLMSTIDPDNIVDSVPTKASVATIWNSKKGATIESESMPGTSKSDRMSPIYYFVTEPGKLKFYDSSGHAVYGEAGVKTTDLAQCTSGCDRADDWEDIDYQLGSITAPVIMAQVQGKDSKWATTAIQNVNSTGFDLSLERGRQGPLSSGFKDIAYLVVPEFHGKDEDLQSNIEFYQGSRDYAQSNELPKTKSIGWSCENNKVNLHQSFSKFGVIVNKQSRVGSHGGWLRYCKQFEDGRKPTFTFAFDEDVESLGDRKHGRAESIGYFAFEIPETELPTNVCNLFPEPIQSWSGVNSELYLGNPININGWSGDYIARYVNKVSEGYQRYDESIWSPSVDEYLLLGFDHTSTAYPLYTSKVCNGDYACDVGNGDGYLDLRKVAQANILPVPQRSTSHTLRIATIDGIKNSCRDGATPKLCSYSESGKNIEVVIEKDLASLTINKEWANDTIVRVKLRDNLYIENVQISSGDNLEFVFPKLSTVTFGTFHHQSGSTQYVFDPGTQVNIRLSMTLTRAQISQEHSYPVLYAPNGTITFHESSIFRGFILADHLIFNQGTIEGAVTARKADFHHTNVTLNKPDYSCPLPPVPTGSLVVTPKYSHVLTCEVAEVEFKVVDDDGNVISSVQDNFTASHTPNSTGKWCENENRNSCSTSSGDYQSHFVNGRRTLYLSSSKLESYDVSGTWNGEFETAASKINFVPYKFDVDEQFVVAGEGYEVTAKVSSCNTQDSSLSQDYVGTPKVSLGIVQPVNGNGAISLLDYTPDFEVSDKGETTDTLSIQEAGQFKITLTDNSFDCSEISGCPESGVDKLSGSFLVNSRPWQFAICTDNDSGGNSSSGNAFVAAGGEFDVFAKPIRFTSDSSPLCNNSLVTQNYLLSAAAVSATHTLDTPSNNGAVLGSLEPGSQLTQSSSDISPDDNGYKFKSLKYSEVGSINFEVTENSNSFYGKILGGFSGNKNIGRFYPDYFKITDTTWTEPDNQAGFTYMSQDFKRVKFAVTAYNANTPSLPTANYQYFNASLKAAFDLTGAYSDRVNILSSALGKLHWTSGAVWEASFDNAQWQRLNFNQPTTTIDGPFNSTSDNSIETQLSLTITESVDPTNFKMTGSDVGALEQLLLAQPDVRYGRMALDDIGGNSGSILSIPLRTEFWDGSEFVVNEDDDRSTFNGSNVCKQVIWTSNDVKTTLASLNGSGSVVDGEEGVTANQNTPAGTDTPREQVRLWLRMDDSEPDTDGGNNISCSGSDQEQPWLRYNWRQLGDEDPSTVVTFGIYRGNDRVIYRGESGLTGQ